MPTTDREIFENNYLLKGVAQDVKDQLFDLAKVEEIAKHKALIEDGEKDVDLIVILRGTVGIYKGGEKLAEAGPGSVIGEIALVDNLPRSADVTSLTAVCVARLDGPVLRKFMFHHRDAGFLMLANLTRVLSGRLRALDKQVEDLKGQSRDPWQYAM
jgi:CRP-like cAMP-binding protein